jgi:hypothetical protein
VEDYNIIMAERSDTYDNELEDAFVQSIKEERKNRDDLNSDELD